MAREFTGLLWTKHKEAYARNYKTLGSDFTVTLLKTLKKLLLR